MILVFLIMSVCKGAASVITKISQKKYVRTFSDSILVMAVLSFFQFVFILILPPYYHYSFNTDMILYPLVFALFYMLSFIYMINSMKKGPTSLTVILENFSMFVPITVGFIVWDESTNWLQLVGLIVFIGSLFVFISSSYRSENIDKKITFKWMGNALLMTFFSGCAVTASKQYALANENSPKEFLLVFNMIIIIVSLIYFQYLKITGRHTPAINKGIVFYMMSVGLIGYGMNILYMLYIGRYSSILFFSSLNASKIIFILLMSRLFLKEKILKKAYIGIVLCFCALLLLSMG